MAIFSASWAEMGDWHRLVFNPSKLASTIGYRLKSGENKIIEFFSRNKLILLFRTIGPVRKIPAGTTTFPPPRE